MNNDARVKESLSALADDECNELESARVLKRLRSDADLRKRWESIHTMRAVMRGERTDLLSADFADKVGRALENEAHMLVPDDRPSSVAPTTQSWRKPIAGLAIAASVAVVSVIGLQTLQNQTPEPRFTASSELGVSQPLAVPASQVRGTRWDVQRAELEQRLNNYLLNHMEYATMGEMQGMLPYSRLAGYDPMPTQ